MGLKCLALDKLGGDGGYYEVTSEPTDPIDEDPSDVDLEEAQQ